MVFSSIPIYSDLPNWPQPQVEVSSETSQLPPRPPPYGGGGGGGGGGSTGSIRQGSMTERARLANIPQPEAALKCPRCESTNTKFCYYNNYSLSQPRHFCKTCKRYWTNGGGLRNVPVGGGCRRNKRRKSSSNIRTKSSSNSSSNGPVVSNSCTQDILGLMVPPPLQVPIFPPLQGLGEYNSSGVGLNFTRIQPPSEAVNGGGGGGGGSIFYSDQWRFQQFPPLANFELPLGGLSLLEGEGIDHQSQNYIGEHKSKQFEAGVTQNSNVVKIEENQGLNLARNSLGVHGNEQYWEANAWSTDLPGFTPHLL